MSADQAHRSSDTGTNAAPTVVASSQQPQQPTEQQPHQPSEQLQPQPSELQLQPRLSAAAMNTAADALLSTEDSRSTAAFPSAFGGCSGLASSSSSGAGASASAQPAAQQARASVTPITAAASTSLPCSSSSCAPQDSARGSGSAGAGLGIGAIGGVGGGGGGAAGSDSSGVSRTTAAAKAAALGGRAAPSALLCGPLATSQQPAGGDDGGGVPTPTTLLALPAEVLQLTMLSMPGGPGREGGAPSACRALHAAWRQDLGKPQAIATHLRTRFGHDADRAVTYVYLWPGLGRVLLPPSEPQHHDTRARVLLQVALWVLLPPGQPRQVVLEAVRMLGEGPAPAAGAAAAAPVAGAGAGAEVAGGGASAAADEEAGRLLLLAAAAVARTAAVAPASGDPGVVRSVLLLVPGCRSPAVLGELLDEAVMGDRPEVVRVLLDGGACARSFSTRMGERWDPAAAVQVRRGHRAHLLLQRGAVPPARRLAPLLTAACVCSERGIVRMVLSARTHEPAPRRVLRLSRSTIGTLVIHALRWYQVPTTHDGTTVFHDLMAGLGQEEEAAARSWLNKLLVEAVEARAVERSRLMLVAGASPVGFMMRIRSDVHVQKLQTLQAAGCGPERLLPHIDPPLHSAVYRKQRQLLAALLALFPAAVEGRARPAQQQSSLDSALIAAVVTGDAAAVKLLVAAGATPRSYLQSRAASPYSHMACRQLASPGRQLSVLVAMGATTWGELLGLAAETQSQLPLLRSLLRSPDVLGALSWERQLQPEQQQEEQAGQQQQKEEQAGQEQQQQAGQAVSAAPVEEATAALTAALGRALAAGCQEAAQELSALLALGARPENAVLLGAVEVWQAEQEEPPAAWAADKGGRRDCKRKRDDCDDGAEDEKERRLEWWKRFCCRSLAEMGQLG